MFFWLQEYSRLKELGLNTDGLEQYLLNSPKSGGSDSETVLLVAGANTSAPAKEVQSAQVPSGSIVTGEYQEICNLAGRPVLMEVVRIGPEGRPVSTTEFLGTIGGAEEPNVSLPEVGTSSTGTKPLSEVSTSLVCNNVLCFACKFCILPLEDCQLLSLWNFVLSMYVLLFDFSDRVDTFNFCVLFLVAVTFLLGLVCSVLFLIPRTWVILCLRGLA